MNQSNGSAGIAYQLFDKNYVFRDVVAAFTSSLFLFLFEPFQLKAENR